MRADLGVIRSARLEFKPQIAFNLLEEFHDNPLYDHPVAGYLEPLQQTYTGCNPQGLLIAHDQALSKKILTFHRIRVPRFGVFPRGRKARLAKKLRYPLIVKSLYEEGSYGISQASIVRSDDKCLERIHYLHEKLQTPTRTSATARNYRSPARPPGSVTRNCCRRSSIWGCVTIS